MMNGRRSPVLRTGAILAIVWSALLVIAGCADSGAATQDAPVDHGPQVAIIALGHPPMQPIVTEIDAVLDQYRDRVTVRRYDAQSEDGKQLAESAALTGHVSIAVLLDGKPEVTLGDRTVRFTGFPQGKAPTKSAEGQWTMEDLRAALDQKLAGT